MKVCVCFLSRFDSVYCFTCLLSIIYFVVFIVKCRFFIIFFIRYQYLRKSNLKKIKMFINCLKVLYNYRIICCCRLTHKCKAQFKIYKAELLEIYCNKIWSAEFALTEATWTVVLFNKSQTLRFLFAINFILLRFSGIYNIIGIRKFIQVIIKIKTI